jgi:REP element-mobilizing transposase RayT
MPRRPRNVLPDGAYHITARGVARTPIFVDDDDREVFLTLLLSTIQRHAWTCHAFCLMTNHYHLIVETLRGRLSRGMHRLNGCYAQAFNERHNRVGHLFQGRYSAYVIEGEDYLTRSCRYVVENPVRAGLCAAPRDWPWSSRLGVY